MAWNVSAVTGFVNATDNLKLHTAATFGNKTPELVDVRMGIKFKEAVHKVDVSTYARVGGCSVTPSGDDTLTDAILEVKSIRWDKDWCPNTLENTYAQKFLSNGSIYSEADALQEVTDQWTKEIAQHIEIMDWQGNTSGGTNPNRNKYDGIHTVITAAGGSIAPTGSGTLAMNETNIRTALRACLTAIPAAFQGDAEFTFKANYAIYQTYLNKIAADNLFNRFAEGNDYTSGIQIENSIYKMIPVHGLTGVNVIYGFKKDNVVMGCDETQTGSDNIGSSRIWFSMDDMKIYGTVRHKRGFVCIRTAEVVRYAFT
jgi:hypothetical protein